MQNAVHRPVDFQDAAHVPFAKLERGIAVQVLDIPKRAGHEIVETEHGMAFGDQPVTKMGADESGRP